MSKMPTQICKQCGEIKPVAQFRNYYNGRKGTYKTCKMCEKINSREKYLRAKDAQSPDGLSDKEQEELDKIHELYDAQRAAGLQPPCANTGSNSLLSSLDSMIDKYKAMKSSAAPTGPSDVVAPAELQKWLTEELTEAPEYYQDEIYEQLKEKYRPVLRIDQRTMMPVYDTTYAAVLEQIAERFDDYEDNYYSK